MMMRIYLVHTSTGCTGLSNRVLMSTERTGVLNVLVLSKQGTDEYWEYWVYWRSQNRTAWGDMGHFTFLLFFTAAEMP